LRSYLDSSVILDLVFNKGSIVFSDAINKSEKLTSRLTQVEVLRSVTRVDPSLLIDAAEILSRVKFVEMTQSIINTASTYPQEITLKSSDAIHMATAEHLLDIEDVLITYDKQMVLNARRLGVKVLTNL
jgi:predicted nucleic acid-binding protein